MTVPYPDPSRGLIHTPAAGGSGQNPTEILTRANELERSSAGHAALRHGHKPATPPKLGAKSIKGGKSAWAKARLTAPEHAALLVRADAAGKTVSEYLRDAIADDRSQFDTQGAIHSLEERLRGVAGQGALESLLVEVVLLCREIVARHNVQALAQVKAQVDARYPGRERIV
jgi:hypothetical protein